MSFRILEKLEFENTVVSFKFLEKFFFVKVTGYFLHVYIALNTREAE